MEQQSNRITDRIVRGACLLAWVSGLAVLWLPEVSGMRHLLANAAATYLLLWGIVFVASRQPRAVIGRRFVLMTGSLAVVLGLLEAPAMLGLVDYRLVLKDPNFDRKNPWRAHPLNRPDPELIQIFAPHHRLAGTQSGGDIARIWDLPPLGEYRYDYRTDQHGFRNETDLTRADIIVLGDSIVWAPFVQANETITAQLQQSRERTVANLAQRGYGPQQELAVLKRFGLPLQPTVCVWTFFEGNDFGDMRRYDHARANWAAHVKSLHSFGKRSFTRSALTLAKELVRPYAGKSVAYEDVAATFRPATGEARPMYFFYGCEDEITCGTNCLDDLRATLEQTHAVCRDAGIQLVFVFVPTKYRVYGRFCEIDSGLRRRLGQPGDLPHRLGKMIAGISRDVAYVDLTGPFVAQAEHGAMLYWPDDTHWSADGHRLAAEVVSRYLVDEHAVPPKQIRLSGAPALEAGE